MIEVENISAFKAKFHEYLNCAARGEEIVIKKGKMPAYTLKAYPWTTPTPPREPAIVTMPSATAMTVSAAPLTPNNHKADILKTMSYNRGQRGAHDLPPTEQLVEDIRSNRN